MEINQPRVARNELPWGEATHARYPERVESASNRDSKMRAPRSNGVNIPGDFFCQLPRCCGGISHERMVREYRRAERDLPCNCSRWDHLLRHLHRPALGGTARWFAQ